MGKMKPVGHEWVLSGLLRTAAEVQVKAPPERVWEILADAGQWSEWHESLSMFETVDGAPLGPNAAFRSKEWIFNNEGVITEWEPNRSVGFALTAGSVSSVYARYAERIELKPAASTDGCTIVHAGRIGLSPVGWLMAGYVLGQALGAMYFDYRTSVRNLARMITE